MGLKSPIPLKDLKFNTPVPYTLHVDRELFQLTKQKLGLFRYPEEQTDFGENNWAQGAKVSRRRLNAIFNHFLVKIDVPGYGPLVLHFTHTNSTRPSAIPLLFSHDWPGSFVEAVRVVRPLTEPEDARDPAFYFVASSIPGCGFSPAPTKSGVGPNVVARAYKILMTDVLRYPKFVTRGGDFGSFITRSIAIQYPQVVRAQHLNMFPVPPPTLWSAPCAYLRWCLSALTYSNFEHESLRVRRNFEQDQSGYLEEQKTRPQTLGFALGDSPLGLLAWEAFGRGMRQAEKTFETYVSVPYGVSMYKKEQLNCPRDWAAQAANILYWREYDRGGHFAFLERPDLFVHDLRSFFSSPVVMQAYARQ
ncbi:Epoxide hydrolase N terminu [Aspergillus parasiticus SU-1]|uniref:Epoxide hydrolase N terminu n=1 Tax=Aspergillus parasiticus (strain ATCC 56775 / NRRL 5862 / SRRC 143 / SU-1) TaxID=1403190 RepID=A0A0F0ICW4_ASPPU|nr:Epoxide hydrolase N terminu [Aspergillus parasiticus SU-1]